MKCRAFLVQTTPLIVAAAVPGRWLLDHTTPTWRIHDPKIGFQRMVSARRAKEIAIAVLDQKRSFPNAIVLATDAHRLSFDGGEVNLLDESRYLVVDGQHRLWAQQFSQYEATYACIIHVGLTVEAMADLFLEINENQKRVPSSLRWDLVRLVRPENDPTAVEAAEIVYLLATEKDSPFFQRIDLTGEQKEIRIKQGSLAPEFKRLRSSRSSLSSVPFQEAYEILLRFVIAIKQVDYDDWGTDQSVFYKARIIRALLRILGDIGATHDVSEFTPVDFMEFLFRINPSTLDRDKLVASQGNAGIKAIYHEIRRQVLPN